jgi:hypothetical protein
VEFKTIMWIRRGLFYVLFVTAAIHLITQAEQFNPSTVMVGRFIFTRPDAWVWVSTETKKPDIQTEVIFRLKDERVPDAAKVFINQFEKGISVGTPTETADRWKSWFQSTSRSIPLSAPRLIGSNTVSYVSITGKFKGAHPNAPIRPNYTLFGAIIDDVDGNIVIRLAGPAEIVEKSTAELKEMIEGALKE